MAEVSNDAYKELVHKYDYPSFMYIEYPHKSFWSEKFNEADFREGLKNLFAPDMNIPLMLYVHVPYCQKLCYFCTCRIEISQDYQRVKNYLKVLYREIELFHIFFDQQGITPSFREVHLGGGSPTYVKEPEFDELMRQLASIVDFSYLDEFAIEIDPRRVKKDRMEFYHSRGINRISFGVQDFDIDVQRAINRVQPAKLTEDLLTPEIRNLFPNGVNFDIICGLPKQTRESMRKTMEKVAELSPDRICLNYLSISPKFAPHQMLMPKSEIPDAYHRKIIFLEALDVLLANGYVRTGYDHFAKPNDAVAEAMAEGKMIWNPLGVTAGRYDDTIGIGVHSYSKLGPDYYSQNFFELDLYESELRKGKFPIYRGYKLNQDDIIRRDVIKTLRSYFFLDFSVIEKEHNIVFTDYFKEELIRLQELAQDGIIILSENIITITELGKQFASLVCRHFDKYAIGESK